MTCNLSLHSSDVMQHQKAQVNGRRLNGFFVSLFIAITVYCTYDDQLVEQYIGFVITLRLASSGLVERTLSSGLSRGSVVQFIKIIIINKTYRRYTICLKQLYPEQEYLQSWALKK